MPKTAKRIQKSSPIRKRLPRVETINLPDTGIKETAYTIIGKHILFVTIEHDPYCENPCTSQDGFGTIRSLSTRHINNISIEEATELLNGDPDVIPLSYFEHGESLWMVKDEPTPAGVEFRWDGRRFAGVWIPDACVRESYTGQDGLSRRDWMIQQAKSACEEYTDWANGRCYWYAVKLYELRTEDGEPYTDVSDYRLVTPLDEDSCGGFIGDYVKEAMIDAGVWSALRTLGYSKRAVSKIVQASK